jgi:hypothetical protein
MASDATRAGQRGMDQGYLIEYWGGAAVSMAVQLSHVHAI